MRTYLVLKNSLGIELAAYPINTSKEYADELVRIVEEEMMVLSSGDQLIFVERDR